MSFPKISHCADRSSSSCAYSPTQHMRLCLFRVTRLEVWSKVELRPQNRGLRFAIRSSQTSPQCGRDLEQARQFRHFEQPSASLDTQALCRLQAQVPKSTRKSVPSDVSQSVFPRFLTLLAESGCFAHRDRLRTCNCVSRHSETNLPAAESALTAQS